MRGLRFGGRFGRFRQTARILSIQEEPMTIRARGICLSLTLAIGLFLPAARTNAQESVPSDRRLPKGTLAYASLRSVQDLKSGWSKTMFGRMLEDPSFEPFLQDVSSHLKEAAGQLESHLGLSLDQLLDLPKGEVAVALLATKGRQIGGVAMIDVSNHEDLRRLLEKAAGALEENGAKRVEDEIEDTPVVLFEFEAAGGGDAGQVRPAGYFFKNATLVVATNADLLKDLLARWDGRHADVLAEAAPYQLVLEKCRAEAAEGRSLATWYVDPMGIVRAALASNPQLGLQGAMAMGFMQTWGVDKLKCLGGTLDLDSGEFDTVMRTFVSIEPSTNGLFNIFQFRGDRQAPPAWVSADCTGYTVFQWDIERAWQTIEFLADSAMGRGNLNKQIEQISQNDEFGRIHLKKDLIDQLTGVVHMVDDVVGTGEEQRSRMVLAIEVKNAGAFKRSLAKLTDIPGFPGKVRQFQGETLYELPPLPLELFGLGGAGLGADEGEEHPMGFAVANGAFLFATDISALEEALRGLGDREALVNSATYKLVAQRFPSRTASISYSNSNAELKAALEMLKGETLRDALLQGALVNIDLGKLPSFDAIEKYLAPSGGFLENDERGFRYTSFSLRKE
jgi:hypothetical protein